MLGLKEPKALELDRPGLNPRSATSWLGNLELLILSMTYFKNMLNYTHTSKIVCLGKASLWMKSVM